MSENVETDAVTRHGERAKATRSGKQIIDREPQNFSDGRFGASGYDDTTGLHAAIVQADKPDAPPGILIRPMRDTDAAQILAIYQAGLDSGNASFETTAPTWEDFNAAKLPHHRHAAVDTTTNQVVGWIAASAVSDRCVYAGVVEHSVYVHPDHTGRGIGLALLNALIQSTETEGIWTIQSGVFPENTASLRLHEKAGFRVVGTRHHLGRHHNRWRDVILLERRSTAIGL
jgi:L-amino acid N-acyltransferase YncA